MERLHYLDFELKIEREGDHYTARVLRSPAGEASSSFTMPFSADRLENLVLKIGRLRTSTRRIHTAEMEAARELGGNLFEAIFCNEVRACLRSSLDEIYRQDETGLRLKLRLQDVPELADLPWEFLHDSAHDRFLAQSNQTPIVRYIEMPERIKPLIMNLPLQVLVMVSSPTDQVRLDVERERSLLQEALHSLSQQGKVRVKCLEKPTLATLQRCLRHETYHIFHFIGHGGFDKKIEEGVLVLEDELGRGWQAGAHRIGALLHDHRSLRLAVLNSCEGARNSRTDPFAGVATTLIRQGVPAVVAMQFEITDDAALIFASEFYTALAEGLPVDAATAEARKAIYAQPNDVEWGTPVLYMRSSDGVLFNLTQKPVAKETLPPEPNPVAALIKSETTPGIQPKTFLSGPIPAEVPAKSKETAKAKESKPGSTSRESKKAPDSKRQKQADVTPAKPKLSLRIARTLAGHTKQVNSVAFSPDGAILASGSGGVWGRGDDTVRLWRVSNGKLLRTLKGHTERITMVDFSPDGSMLASESNDATLRLWQVSNGKFIDEIGSGHTCVFSSDWTKLASGSIEGPVELWRVSGVKHLRTLKGHADCVQSIAFSPDSSVLASGSDDKTVQLWRVSDGKLLRTLKHDPASVSEVTFSPDGAILASGADDCNVRLWQVSDGKLLRTLKGHTAALCSVAFSPDGAALASASSDETVRLWSVSDGKTLCELQGVRILFSSDGTKFATFGTEKTIYLWRVPTGKRLYKLEGHTKEVFDVDFSPDGTILASGSDDQTVRLWQLE